MKLHLPHKLRKALLVRLASLALALPTTLATASGAAAALIALSVLPAQRAAADPVDYGEAQSYTEEVTVSSETGPKWYSGIADGSILTVQGGENADAPSGDLKLSNNYKSGNEPAPKLTLRGAVDSLYFTADEGANKGAFQFGSTDKWVMEEGASIKDIYIVNAELFLRLDVDLGNANVHVSGCMDSQPYEGTLRAHSHTVTIGGDLAVEGAGALISVQGGGQIIVGGHLTGTGELTIGVYDRGTVTLKQGGTLGGALAFKGTGTNSAKLVLEKAADAAAASALTVQGLISKEGGGGGIIVTGGEGQGGVTLTLNGTAAEYAYRGTIGTDAAPDETTHGWADASSLDLVVGFGAAESQQTIAGDVHVRNFTISGGKFVVPSGTGVSVQVDGNMQISGTGSFAFGDGDNCPSHLIVNGNLTVGNLDDPAREAFFTQGQSTTLIKGQFRAASSLKTYGQLTLEQGGELTGTLRCGWAAGITLGGDLSVGGLDKGNNQATSISKLEGTQGTVYLLQRIDKADNPTSQDLQTFYNNLTGWKTVNDGVGFGKTGEGTLELNGTGTIAYDFKVAAGTLTMHNTDSAAAVVFEKSLTGDGNVEFDAYDRDGSKNVAYEVKGEFSLGGTLTVFGGNNVESSTLLTLARGGSVGVLCAAWGAEVKLGGDLTVNDLLADSNDRKAKFTKVDGTEGPVNLVFNVAEGEKTSSLNGYTFMDVGFVKSGAGTLKLTGGASVDTDVTVRGGTLSLDASAYTFSKSVTISEGNALVAGGGSATMGTLKLASGARVTLMDGTLKAGTLDLEGTGTEPETKAKLQVDLGSSATLDFGEIKPGADGKLTIELTGYAGQTSYQLFEGSTFENVWNALVKGEDWEDVFEFEISEEDIGSRKLDLEKTGLLRFTPTMDWTGEGDTWNSEKGEEWQGVGDNPDGADVLFDEKGTNDEGKGTVQIEGTVGPRNVYVQGGEYTFTQTGEGGGMEMEGELHVGGGNADAKLTLDLANTSIPSIVLHENGTLVLADDAALPEGTKIKFTGGMLEYSAATLTETDVSAYVADTGEGSTAAVKVSVVKAAYGRGVTWGDANTAVKGNGGLTHALNESGLVKSGDGDFTLAWKGDEEKHSGALTVDGGTLKLEVGGEKSSQLTGDITGAGRLTISGGSITLSGTNTVKEIELGAKTTTVISGTGALGGAGTTLILSGGSLTGSGDGATASAGTVNANADTTVSGATLAGVLTGGAKLTAGGGTTAGLSGDISGYTGTLDTGENGTWELSEAAVTGGVTAVGKGTLAVKSEGDGAYFTGTVGTSDAEDTLTLSNTGTSTLYVVGGASSTGAKLDGGTGGITLGDTGKATEWNGSEVTGGTVTLSNVTLGAEGFKTKGEGVKVYVDTALAPEAPAGVATYAAESTGGVVNVNGMKAENLDGIIINASGQLTGVSGTYTAGRDKHLELHFTEENMGAIEGVGSKEKALIVGQEGFTLNASSKYDVILDLAEVAGDILDMLNTPEGGEVYLHLVQGGTLDMGEDELSLSDFEGLEIFESVVKNYTLGVKGGDIVLTGAAKDVYVVEGGETVDASVPESMKAVVFETGQSATFTTEDEATLHNLLGESGSTLRLQKGAGASGEVTFTLDNTYAGDIVDAVPPDEPYPTPEGTTVRGQDTTFLGSITGEAGVSIVKDGKGTLTVGGNYTLDGGSTTLRHGRLVLRGTENRMDELVFDYTDTPGVDDEATEQDEGEERGLVLEKGKSTIGSIDERGTDVSGNEVRLENGAELILTGASTLSGTRFTGGDGGGTLTLEKATEGSEVPSLSLAGEDVAVLSGLTVNVRDGGELTVSGDGVTVQDSELKVEAGTVKLAEGAVITGTGTGSSADIADNGVLDLGGSTGNTLTELKGSGTLRSAAGGTVTVEGGTFSGTLDSSAGSGSAGTLAVAAGANFTLDNVSTTAANATQGWGVKVGNGAHLTVDVSKKGTGNIVTLGDIDLGTGNTLTVKINAETYNGWDDVITGNTLTFGEGTTVVLEAVTGNGEWSLEQKLTLGKFEDVKGDWEKDLEVELVGDAFRLSEVEGVTWGEDKRLEVHLKAYEGNRFEDAITRDEKNGLAGARMAWNSYKVKRTSGTVGKGAYKEVMDGLFAMAESQDKAGLQRALASVAGASIATLGPAVAEDVHRQLTAIRNRTTTMASEVTQETYEKLPLWHAWLNAETNYRKLDAEGLAPGYTLNSWGGTVGADADLTRHLTVGLALTAMYGDLKTDSADNATGDLDTAYMSFFARVAHGAWVHTLVLSGGRADAELNRTISYGTGSCRVSGSTDGLMYGAMYEVGYTRLVNKRGTAALQPVINVEVRHVALKGYTEGGTDIGLNTDDIDQTVVTFGAGARTQVVVGTNVFNRTAVLEARTLLKVDVGDRTGTARNAIVGDTTREEVESAEVGAVGVELGAGLNVPLGARFGSVFLDGSLEFRDGMTGANATLGYRINF